MAEPVEGSWPVLEGRYKVGNRDSPIAVCTMATVDMEFPMERIAIAGKCVTENMGIEKIVKNTISNPHIRYMIICGKVPMGHFVDNAIVSLIDNGVDPEGRIIGARGGIPVVKNLTREEIERFRKQVTPILMPEVTDVSKVMERVDELFEKNPGPFRGNPMIASEKIETIEAKHSERDFVSDPKGYFTIHPNNEKEQIAVEHHDINGKIDKIIVGKTHQDLYHAIIRLNLVSSDRPEHLAYLGSQLVQAEIAMKRKIPYEQDRLIF